MLAVGIEAGAREELSRITLNANRVLVANMFNQISKSDGSIFESIQVMVANPPGYGCLLYTSPSPRDGLLSRMPSSA